MTEKEKQILARLTIILSQLSESEKYYLLGFSNGMAVSAECQEAKEVALQTK